MYAVYQALSLFFFPLEILASAFAFPSFFHLRRKRIWLFILAFFFLLGTCFLLSWAKEAINVGMGAGASGGSGDAAVDLFSDFVAVVSSLILFFLTYLAFVLTMDESPLNLLYGASGAFATRGLFHSLFNLIVLLAVGNSVPLDTVSLFIAYPWTIALYIGLAVSGIFLTGFILGHRFLHDDTEFINWRILLPVFVIMIFNLILSTRYAPKGEESSKSFYLLLLCQILLSALTLFIQFYLVRWSRLQINETKMIQMEELKARQYEIAKESADSVNMNAHDLKKQITLILEAGGGNAIDASSRNELLKMENSVNLLCTNFRTGNQALDVTLTEKAGQCLKNKIPFTAMADGSKLSFVSDIDIYTCFGNALDNAIEASLLLDEASRSILFSLAERQGVVAVHIENNCQGGIRFENGIPQTSKKDKHNHGFGIRSIQKTVEKYGGAVALELKKGRFCMDIILPLPQTKGSEKEKQNPS